MSRIVIAVSDSKIGIGYVRQNDLQKGIGIMAEHKHGSMDITGHVKTYNGFIRMVTWGTILCIVVLIFLAIAKS